MEVAALIAAVVLLAVAAFLPHLRRASRWADAVIHAHNTEARARTANPDTKENNAA